MTRARNTTWTGARRPAIAIVAASPGIIGGHSVQAAALGDALTADGADVRLVPIDPRLPAGLRWSRRVTGLRTLVNEACYAAALRTLARVDVVHVFSASYWSFLLAAAPAMLAGRALGKRVILHYHSGELADHLANWGWRVHPWLALAHEIVVCSDFQRREFERFGYRASVIPNVVDTTRFAFRDRTSFGPRLICNRNFEMHYGVHSVLEAFAWIRADHPEATLLLAGAGSQADQLTSRARSLGTKGITFAGPVPPQQMPAHLDMNDIFVNASTTDNQPVSIIEAQASGLPVVSTPTGGIPEMIEHGQSGVLVSSPTPRLIAAAVQSLLDRPEWARAMARRAHDRIPRFQWAAVRAAWSAVYRVPLGGIRPRALDVPPPPAVFPSESRA